MRELIVAELAALAVMWAAFVVFHVATGGWRSQVGRQLTAMAVVGLVEALGLVAAGIDHAPPRWVYVMIFGVTDVVAASWLVLLWRSRRAAGRPPPEQAGASSP